MSFINDDVKDSLSCESAVFPVMLEKDNNTETFSLLTDVDNDEGLLASLG